MTDGLYRGPVQKKKQGHSTYSKATPARKCAADTLHMVEERSAFAREILDKQLKEAGLSREDRAFTQVLVLGVVSTQGVLDDIIDRCLRSPHDVEENVRSALRISVYELYYLKKESYVVVSQGVELVKYVEPKAGKLANAVLRKAAALLSEFPFGDPAADKEALARLFGFPTWLADYLIADLGAAQAMALMKASNEPAPVFVAVNAARATDGEVCALFERCGCALEPQKIAGQTIAGCYHVAQPAVLLDGRIARAFKQGKILVSDVAAQAISQLILPEQKPRNVLEIGSGRGTKTVLLQSGALRKYKEQLDYTTLDNHAFKTKLLKERAKEYDIQVKDAVTKDATLITPKDFSEPFDLVFVDAPCSGLGTMRRHPEIRWRISEVDIDALAQTSLSILKAASSVVAPGGRLVYSTCTVTKKENEQNILAFLKSPEGADFQIVPLLGHASFATSVTSGASDAHFAVCFARK